MNTSRMNRIVSCARSVLLALACLLVPSGAEAQDLPEDLTQLPLEQLMAIDVVYGASKHDQRTTEAPSSVSVVTAADIERYGYRTLADVLRSVHGFYSTYDRNYTYVGIRGFSRPSDYNSRFLLLVDGHRVNDNFYGSGYIGPEGLIDLDLVDRVEVIRGPSSSLYGTSAFFAVVNVITRMEPDVPRLQFSGLGASYGTPAGRVTFAHAFEDGPKFLVSGSAFRSDGQRLFYKEYDDPLSNNGVTQHSDDERNYRLFSTMTFRDFTVQLAANSREKGIPTGAYGTPFNDPGARTVDDRSYLDVKYDHAFAGGTGVQARVYVDRYYYRGDYPYYSPYPTIIRYREHSWGDWWGTEAKVMMKAGTRQTVTAGMEFRDNLKQHFRWKNVDPGPLDFDSQRSSREGGLYFQDEMKVSDQVAVSVGVRHDHYETFGGSTHPRAALILMPFERTALKLLYGSAFRAPVVYELYYGSHANPDLKPESIRTFEVVLEQYALGNLRLTGSAYYYAIDDLVSVDTVSNLFENIDEVTAKGVELEVAKRFKNGFEVTYSSTLQENRDQGTDRILTNSPRHLAKLNAFFPIKRDKLGVGAEVQYTSRRLTLSGNDAPGFAVANLTFLSRQLAKGLDLSASVYNVFDKKYGDPGGPQHLQDVIEQDGRSFRLKFTWGF
ncbi:MAG TPA: TonB-dependent receptor [Candidatus Polarisedimenticolia bacterium]|nr:TonB-dependent receptor [Candidatus Polarisedimenticolia bacterium]